MRATDIDDQRRDRGEMVGPGEDVQQAGSQASKEGKHHCWLVTGEGTATALSLNRLHLEEFLDRQRTNFPADARFLVAAEWCLHIESAAIDIDLCGPHLLRHG